MMKKSNLFLSLCIILFSFSILSAQDETKTSGETRFGVGVALIDLQQIFEASTQQANAVVTVPIILASGLRIEPELGLFATSQSADIGGTTVEQTTRSWNIGVGVFPQNIIGKFSLYYGGRVGYISKRLTDDDGVTVDEETTTGFYIAPGLGGEHHFSDHFSIGAEVMLVYASLTNEEDGRDFDIDLTVINTRTLVFFRFYF